MRQALSLLYIDSVLQNLFFIKGLKVTLRCKFHWAAKLHLLVHVLAYVLARKCQAYLAQGLRRRSMSLSARCSSRAKEPMSAIRRTWYSERNRSLFELMSSRICWRFLTLIFPVSTVAPPSTAA